MLAQFGDQRGGMEGAGEQNELLAGQFEGELEEMVCRLAAVGGDQEEQGQPGLENHKLQQTEGGRKEVSL